VARSEVGSFPFLVIERFSEQALSANEELLVRNEWNRRSQKMPLNPLLLPKQGAIV
jgi:hypothetical protein